MIKGKRVFLRAVEERDLALLLQWTNDPEIAAQVVGWTFPLSSAHQREWFHSGLKDQTTRRFIVEAPEIGAIGLTGLWEIDWHNRTALTALKLGDADIRGKGYGTDAILTLMSYAFYTVGINRLWTSILPFNIASYRAYVEKCGWQVEGVARQEVYRNGKFYDLIRIASLAEDFSKHPLHKQYAPHLYLNQVEPKVTILDSHWANSCRSRVNDEAG